MKEQIKSVDKYVEGLHREIWDQKEVSQHWIGKAKELEDEVKKKDDKIYALQTKQKELQKTIDRLPPGLLDELEAFEKARRKTITRNDWIR